MRVNTAAHRCAADNTTKTSNTERHAYIQRYCMPLLVRLRRRFRFPGSFVLGRLLLFILRAAEPIGLRETHITNINIEKLELGQETRETVTSGAISFATRTGPAPTSDGETKWVALFCDCKSYFFRRVGGWRTMTRTAGEKTHEVHVLGVDGWRLLAFVKPLRKHVVQVLRSCRNPWLERKLD